MIVALVGNLPATRFAGVAKYARAKKPTKTMAATNTATLVTSSNTCLILIAFMLAWPLVEMYPESLKIPPFGVGYSFGFWHYVPQSLAILN
jgi:hypothetical protein